MRIVWQEDSTMKKAIVAFILLITVSGVFAAQTEEAERIYRSYQVFGSSIDKLLLETPHVYVRVDNETDHYYVPKIGLAYYTNISMTLSAGLPKIAEQWSEWFSGASGSSIIINKNKDGEHSIRIERDDADETEPEETGNEEEAAKKDETAKKEEKEQKLKDMQQSDADRIQKMTASIEAFQIEVMELILDFAPIIKIPDPDDSLVLVFRVADSEYFDRYKTNSLVVQIPFKSIRALTGKDVRDSSVRKAFNWNI